MKKLLIVLLLVTSVFAAFGDPETIQTISNYNTVFDFNSDGTAHVTQTMAIKNELHTGIVPGKGTITLSKESPDYLLFVPVGMSTKHVEVSNLEAQDQNGDPVTVRANFEQGQTSLEYEMFSPVEAGEETTVVINYDTDGLTERGVLFTSAAIPAVSIDLPVNNIERTIRLPQGSSVTYGDDIMTGALVTTDSLDTINFEYSALPLPRLPLSGGVVFWFAIAVLIFIGYWVLIEGGVVPKKKK